MKKLIVIVCLLLAVLFIVTACSEKPPEEQSTGTSAPTASVTDTPTEPQETQPQETQPQETQPQETQPQETQPQETQPPETQPQETQPVNPPVDSGEIGDTVFFFSSDVDSHEVGEIIDNTDLFNLFDMTLPSSQRGCGVEEWNGQKVYAMRKINELYQTNEGLYYFKMNIAKTTPRSDNVLLSYMVVRGYRQVISDWMASNEDAGPAQIIAVREFFADDGVGNMGGSGIYATIMDDTLYVNVKYYDETSNRRIGNKLYTIPCTGTELTMADDGSIVHIMVGEKVLVQIELAGSIKYDDMDCAPGDTFAATATIRFFNGIVDTIENTLIADTPLSQFGIANRGGSTSGALLFSYVEYGAFSSIALPEFTICDHDWVEATCTTPKTCSICMLTEGKKLGHRYVENVCTGCEAIDPISLLSDTTVSFTSDVSQYNVGENVKQTDLKNLFNMTGMLQDGCFVEEQNGQKVYAMHMINEMRRINDGFYFFKTNIQECEPISDGKIFSWMIVRGYHKVVSDETAGDAFPILYFLDNDNNGNVGGAGIYATIVDGNLHIVVKYYDASVRNRVANKHYTLPCTGTELTMADDGHTIYIMVGDELMATIELSGSTTYADIRERNCSIGNTFADSAKVTLIDGTVETIENTLVADTPLSECGIVNRGGTAGGTFMFSSLEFGAFSAITIPKMGKIE